MTKNELKYYSKLRQKKYRDSENKFLIEGNHLISECLRSVSYKDLLLKIFVKNNYSNEILLDELKKSNSKIEIDYVDEKIINQLAETINSQGIIGVVSKLNYTETKINHSENKLLVALDSVNDPGNLGTIVRTCNWFGVDGLLLGTNSVDLYNSKTIRATQGSLFNLAINNDVNLEEELVKYFENGYKIVLSSLDSDKYLSEYKFSSEEKLIFVFGNEALGINKNILNNKNFHKIKIKGYTDCESLNISVSVGIFLNSVRNFI